MFGSSRCVDADWYYLVVTPTSLVHVDDEAAVGSAPILVRDPGVAAWPEGRRLVTDALLNPARRTAVSLGWVRWFGLYGQLVLNPPGSDEWSDHLVFYVPPNADRVSYAFSVHAAWKHLVQIVATLKAIVGSTPLAR